MVHGDQRIEPLPLTYLAGKYRNQNGVSPFWRLNLIGYSDDMPRRTYEADGSLINSGEDLDDLVTDKRQGWRASPANARRRQRRYRKRLTKALQYTDKSSGLVPDVGE
jgi:hypothetical protein